MRKVLLACCIFLISACHPFFMFRPPAIKSNTLSSLSEAPAMNGSINVAIDKFGVPFIKAKDNHSAIYALGFLHARDRLFQLDLIRHAAMGRVAELFGDKGLESDRKLRFLSYKLEEQLAALSSEERLILDAYVRGVNDGAKQRGRSAEHFLLGIEFEEFSALQVVAIGRLQAWQLAADLFPEIVRLKFAKSALSAEAKKELFASVDDRRAAVIEGDYSAAETSQPSIPIFSKSDDKKAVVDINGDVENLIQLEGGASNAWAIEGRLMENKQAVLMNDPHLRHAWPSNFYLATLATDNFQASGATFVGVPAILIGVSKTVSWGVTASYLNTQDTVLLRRDPVEAEAYWVDGKKYNLEKWPQKFCLDKKGNCLEEVYFVSIFGPVMDSRHDQWIDKNDLLAIMWTAFLTDKHSKITTSFIELAQAKNVAEAKSVIGTMTLPGVNMVLADIFGNIGYAYAGLVPSRAQEQHAFLPLDGSKSSSLWSTFLEKPQVLNPDKGFIVTANQNIFSHGASEFKSFAKQGAPPYRALRIQDRLNELLSHQQPLNFNEVAHIQVDSFSIEAKELAPLLGKICQESFKDASDAEQQFAKLIANFDGIFSTESLAALPYEMMINEVIEDKLKTAVGTGFAKRALYVGQINYGIKQALFKELSGSKSALFAGDSVRDRVKELCAPAFERLRKMAGHSPWQWRWGRHHYLQRQSPLAAAPLVGTFFRDRKREVAGSASSPLAETGTPVMYGANMRFQALMSSPPQLKVTLDSGNSGVVGHKNSLDQAVLWHKGEVFKMATEWKEAVDQAVTSFSLKN